MRPAFALLLLLCTSCSLSSSMRAEDAAGAQKLYTGRCSPDAQGMFGLAALCHGGKVRISIAEPDEGQVLPEVQTVVERLRSQGLLDVSVEKTTLAYYGKEAEALRVRAHAEGEAPFQMLMAARLIDDKQRVASAAYADHPLSRDLGEAHVAMLLEFGSGPLRAVMEPSP
jgi:hypothetical protein